MYNETDAQIGCKETDAPQACVPHRRGPVSLGVVPRPAHRSRAPPAGHIQGRRSLLFNLSDGRGTKVSCHSNETATPRGLTTPSLSPRGHGPPSPPRSAARPAGQGTSRPEEWKSPMQQRRAVTARRVGRGFRRRWSPRWRVHTAFPKLHVCHHWYRRESAGEPSRGGSIGGRERRAPARGHRGPSPQAGASKRTAERTHRMERREGKRRAASVTSESPPSHAVRD